VLLIAATLLVGSGCAKTDWIDRTLVTVDVTGTWEGFARAQVPSGTFRLELDQQGSVVKGVIQVAGGGAGRFGATPGPIAGTVAGDVFRFKETRGSVEGEMTVSGDEMTGQMSWLTGGSRQIFLRRIDPSSPPGSPPR
jgi:hypothetical protein